MSATAHQPQSHAEQVRLRRAQESQQRIHHAAENARRAGPAVPVYTRATTATATKPRRTQPRANTRRQVYYSLSTPGAEVRLPAMPALHFGWRLVSLVMVILLGIALTTLYNGALFQVESVRLVGAQRLTAADVITTLDVQGLPAISIDPAEMNDEILNAFPEVKSASVKVGLPASMVVTVKERQPIIVWEQGDTDTLVDADGYAFPVRGDMPEGMISVRASGSPAAPAAEAAPAADPAANDTTKLEDKPAAPAVGATPMLTPDMVQSILLLNGQKPEKSRVEFDPRYGFGWKDPGGWNVYFGLKTDDLTVKLQQYQVISAQLNQQGIKPSMVSVEFVHAPFYRVEQ